MAVVAAPLIAIGILLAICWPILAAFAATHYGFLAYDLSLKQAFAERDVWVPVSYFAVALSLSAVGFYCNERLLMPKLGFRDR